MSAIRAVSTGVWNTTAGAKSDTIAAVPGDLLVAVSGHDGQTGSHVLTDDQGGVWVQAISALSATSVDSVQIWVRTTLVQKAATYTVTTTPASSTGGGLQVFAVSGMLRAGLAAVRSSGKQDNQTAATTPAPVLGLTPLASSTIVTGLIDGTNGSANQNPRAGYTERFDNGHNVPATGFATSTDDSGETTATLTFGGTTPSIYGVVAVELDSTDPSMPQPRPILITLDAPDSPHAVPLTRTQEVTTPPQTPVVTGQAVSYAKGRATAKGTDVVKGLAVGRAKGRAATVALALVIATSIAGTAGAGISESGEVVSGGITESGKVAVGIMESGQVVLLGTGVAGVGPAGKGRGRSTSLASAVSTESPQVQPPQRPQIGIGLARMGPPVLRSQEFTVQAAAATITGQTVGQGHGRTTARGTDVVFGAAVTRTHGYAPVKGTDVVKGAAVGRDHARATAVGTDLEIGRAIGRAHAKATAVGIVLEIGRAVGRDHARATAVGTNIEIGKAVGRDHARAAVQASVIVTGKAQGRQHSLALSQGNSSPGVSTADSPWTPARPLSAGFQRIGPPVLREQEFIAVAPVTVVTGQAVSQAHGRATARGTDIELGQAAGKAHAYATARGLNIEIGKAVGRDHARATAVGTRIVLGAAVGRAHSLGLARGTNIEIGKAQGRSHSRAVALATNIEIAKAVGQAHGRATSSGTAFTLVVEATVQQPSIRAAGFRRIGPPILREQQVDPQATPTVIVTAQAVSYGHGRAPARAVGIEIAKAVGRAHSLATARGADVAKGQAIGRAHTRATARGTGVVIGRAAGKASSRATTRASDLVLGRAAGRTHSRALSSCLVITRGAAVGRTRSRSTFRSTGVLLGRACGRAHSYSHASGGLTVPPDSIGLPAGADGGIGQAATAGNTTTLTAIRGTDLGQPATADPSVNVTGAADSGVRVVPQSE